MHKEHKYPSPFFWAFWLIGSFVKPKTSSHISFCPDWLCNAFLRSNARVLPPNLAAITYVLGLCVQLTFLHSRLLIVSSFHYISVTHLNVLSKFSGRFIFDSPASLGAPTNGVIAPLWASYSLMLRILHLKLQVWSAVRAIVSKVSIFGRNFMPFFWSL